MIKKIALILALTSVPTFAATISVVRSGNGVIATTSGGTTLTAGGYYISVGSYGDAAAPVVTDNASFVAALASFKEFASATAPTSGTTQGTITGSFVGTGSAPNAPSDFNSKSLYILVGNAATRAASTEFAIIQGTPTWSFVGDVTIGSASATISLIDSTAFSAVAGAEVDNATGKDNITLRAIPEPSAAILGILSLGLLARRKR
jgi:hypothetical protein